MSKFFYRARRRPATSLLLALLLLRAYVPVGFMPASGTPFLLELCPAAAPMRMSTPMTGHIHSHSDTTHSQFQTCPFGSAPASGPIPNLVAFSPPAPIVPQILPAFEPVGVSERVDRAHPPRGPPSLA